MRLMGAKFVKPQRTPCKQFRATQPQHIMPSPPSITTDNSGFYNTGLLIAKWRDCVFLLVNGVIVLEEGAR